MTAPRGSAVLEWPRGVSPRSRSVGPRPPPPVHAVTVAHGGAREGSLAAVSNSTAGGVGRGIAVASCSSRPASCSSRPASSRAEESTPLEWLPHSRVGALGSLCAAACPSQSSESVIHSTQPCTSASLPPNTFRKRVLTAVPHRWHRPSAASSGWDMAIRWGSSGFVMQCFSTSADGYGGVTSIPVPGYRGLVVRLPPQMAATSLRPRADSDPSGSTATA